MFYPDKHAVTDMQEPPFDFTLLVHFRKRLGKDIINEINEMIALGDDEQNPPDDPDPPGSSKDCDDKQPEFPEFVTMRPC